MVLLSVLFVAAKLKDGMVMSGVRMSNPIERHNPTIIYKERQSPSDSVTENVLEVGQAKTYQIT